MLYFIHYGDREKKRGMGIDTNLCRPLYSTKMYSWPAASILWLIVLPLSWFMNIRVRVYPVTSTDTRTFILRAFPVTRIAFRVIRRADYIHSRWLAVLTGRQTPLAPPQRGVIKH